MTGPWRWLVWWVLLAAGCASFDASSGQSSNQALNSSFRGSTASTGTPSSGESSRASSSSSNASSSSSNGGVGSVSSVASSLVLTAAGGIAVTVYFVQLRAADQLKRKKFQQQRDEPQDPGPVAPVPVPVPEENAPPLPVPDLPVPAEPTAPPLPDPSPPPPDAGAVGQLESEPPLDAMVMARWWLLANELQLSQDLALGAGPAIEDLAGIAGIAAEHRGHFGRLLQRHRAALLTGHEVTPRQAARAMARVGSLVMSDPLLRPDGEAFLAAW